MTVKSSLLEMLEKNKGEVLSGESIAGELGCTRAAVWKAVKSLREEGYHIEAGPNKGYMLDLNNKNLEIFGIANKEDRKSTRLNSSHPSSSRMPSSA